MTLQRILQASFFLGILVCVAACGPNSANEELIVGHWNAMKWETEKGSRSAEIDRYWFDFKSDGTYTSKFGGAEESGTYRVEYNRLYTHNEGDDEIVVEIKSLTSDTMRIGMNRSGIQETLVLAK